MHPLAHSKPARSNAQHHNNSPLYKPQRKQREYKLKRQPRDERKAAATGGSRNARIGNFARKYWADEMWSALTSANFQFCPKMRQ